MSPRLSPGHLILALVCAPLLMGGACEKKSPDKPTDTGAIGAADKATDPGAADPKVVPNTQNASAEPMKAGGTVDTTPLPGVDTSRLDTDKQKLFYQMLAELNSPCGKAHSLRTSVTTDASCKRAPFAVRYILAMVEDEATDATIKEYYTQKYSPKPAAPAKFDVAHAPHDGNEDAPVKIYEFFDYECPHCEHFKPQMEQVLSERAGKVVTYYMMFPLESIHRGSKGAAQGALAAAAQGKFKPMHDKLFASSHDHDSVFGMAKEVGLDMTKFEADYNAADPLVEGYVQQGLKYNVNSTPTIFFNDRKYEGPPLAKYLMMWIDEELAAK